MRSSLSNRPTLAVLGVFVIVAWFAIAGYLFLYILGSGLDYYGEGRTTPLQAGHVALVWAGVLLAIAFVGVVLGLMGRSRGTTGVSSCVAVISLIVMVWLGMNYSRLQRYEQPPTPTYVPSPTWTHCQVYSGGSNDCPGG